MRIDPRRSARPELPRAVRRPAEPFEDADGELLRLLGGGEPRSAFAPADPTAGADAFASLATVLGSLADEEADARALEALDPAARMLMAPRLAAVRRMAETALALLALRAEAEARRRGTRDG
jgi:hypothetical protein